MTIQLKPIKIFEIRNKSSNIYITGQKKRTTAEKEITCDRYGDRIYNTYNTAGGVRIVINPNIKLNCEIINNSNSKIYTNSDTLTIEPKDLYWPYFSNPAPSHIKKYFNNPNCRVKNNKNLTDKIWKHFIDDMNLLIQKQPIIDCDINKEGFSQIQQYDTEILKHLKFHPKYNPYSKK